MKLKTYHAKSVEAAMRIARIELGEQALFLGSDEDGSADEAKRFRATFALPEDGDDPGDAVAQPAAELERPHWRRYMALPGRPAAQPAGGAAAAARAEAPNRAVRQPDVRQPEVRAEHARAFAEALADARSGAATAPAPEVASRPAIQRPAAMEAARVSAPAALKRSEAPAERATSPESLDRVREEIRELRRELEHRVAAPTRLTPAPLRYSRLAVLYDRLTACGVGAAEAGELVAPLEGRAEAGEGLRALEAALRARMQDGWRVAAGSSPREGGRAAVLIGPSGAGKTSVAAKLAVRWGAAGRGSVRLYSVDQLRVGAVEPLQAYAGLLGAELELVDAPEDLAEALAAGLAEEPGTTAIVDTPGYAPNENARMDRLAAALEQCGELETHLVLPPGLHPLDMRRVIERYRRLQPTRLLFSRLDETAATGGAWNAFLQLGAPVSYLSTGPQAPDDLQPASAAALTERILPEEAEES